MRTETFALECLAKAFSSVNVRTICGSERFGVVDGHYERRIWEPSPGVYPPLARLQRGFAYHAFVPGGRENVMVLSPPARFLHGDPSNFGFDIYRRS
jgi:hypothetical protein